MSEEFDPFEEYDTAKEEGDEFVVQTAHRYSWPRDDVRGVRRYALYTTQDGYERFYHDTETWDDDLNQTNIGGDKR